MFNIFKRRERSISSLERPDEDPKKIMSDLWRVGPEKPMGYLPIATLTDICGEIPGQVKMKLEAIGLKARIFMDGKWSNSPGALYVWDEEALAKLLNENAETLRVAGWPIDSTAFVAQVARIYAENNSELYKLIGKAFVDERFKDK